jgi:hypothetical protein
MQSDDWTKVLIIPLLKGHFVQLHTTLIIGMADEKNVAGVMYMMGNRELVSSAGRSSCLL